MFLPTPLQLNLTNVVTTVCLSFIDADSVSNLVGMNSVKEVGF